MKNILKIVLILLLQHLLLFSPIKCDDIKSHTDISEGKLTKDIKHQTHHFNLVKRFAFGRQDSCSNDYKFDYYNFNLQWGPGYCKTSPSHCDRNAEEKFTIHGLWPTTQGHKYGNANCCFDNVFKIELLNPIIDEMKKNWPSLHGSNTKFWSHEWLKHGTCARDAPNLHGQLPYFNGTLALLGKLPILEKLRDENIVPGEKPIAYEDLINALKKITNGKHVTIGCDYEHHQPIPILTSISICLDRDQKTTDCPQTNNKCQRSLIMPSSSQQKKQSFFQYLLSYFG